MNLDEAVLERIVEQVLLRLSQPQVELEASGRHIHLSHQAVETLFGKGYTLTKKSDLSQPGQYACNERVEVVGPKGKFSSVIVLGPERGETQLELSSTDAVSIGVKAPLRLSGDIHDTPGIHLVGPKGEMDITSGVIVAKRHIHMTPEDASRFGLKDKQMVTVKVPGERSVTFNEVALRVSPQFATYMHIDYDEANACGFKKGMMGIIIP